jgi:hypothetical protein
VRRCSAAAGACQPREQERHSEHPRPPARRAQVCDQGGRKPFPTDKLLSQHLRSAHHSQLCAICTAAGRRFPLEYPALGDAALQQHLKAEHPL